MVTRMKGIHQQLQQAFAEALHDAGENFREGAKLNTANQGGVKYSINRKFYDQIDNWDGETTGFSFVLGNTSDALQEAGIPQRQIRWDASKIKKLLGKHNGMTIEIVKKIPELLEHPVVIIDSKQNNNARIVMGDLYDEHGKVVTVVLLLTPTSRKGNVLDVIKVSSAEGRSHIQSLFKKDDGTTVTIRYADKKRIQSWLNVNRLQLPLHNLDLDSTSSIGDFEPKVNKNSATNSPKSLRYQKNQAAQAHVAQQNVSLEEDVQSLNQLTAEQRKRGNAGKLQRSALDAAASFLMKTAGAKGDKGQLVQILDRFYTYVGTTENTHWEDVREQALPVVRWLMDNTVRLQQHSYLVVIDFVREGN